jgi:hypothetical protein
VCDVVITTLLLHIIIILTHICWVLIKKQSKNREFQSTTDNGLNLQSLYMCMAGEGRWSGFGMDPGTLP